LHPPSGSSPKAEAEFGGLISEYTLVANLCIKIYGTGRLYRHTQLRRCPHGV
jgi:hypothetical protein